MQTRSQARPPSADDDAAGLEALLHRPVAELAKQPGALIERLEAASPAALTLHAPKLLELLDAPALSRADRSRMGPREALARAVMRVGYPWALQLKPEDLALTRLEPRRLAGQRRRRVLTVTFAALTGVALALAGGALLLARLGPEPAPPALTPRFVIPSVDDVAPTARRAAVLEAEMQRLAADARHDEAISLALDCLADELLEAEVCLRGLAGLLRTRATATGDATFDELAARAASLRWQLKTEQGRFAARSTLRQLRRLARTDTRALPTAEAAAAAERFAHAARLALTRGDFKAAADAGEACLAQVADDVDCHLVLYGAHSGLATQVPHGEALEHGQEMERQRAAVARIVSHAKRRACEVDWRGHGGALGCPVDPSDVP
ncbi:MAG: hypothetical protein IAE78_21055 [Myxococcus sp.]|nr:hypothetical protein [Myxococcus sp.]